MLRALRILVATTIVLFVLVTVLQHFGHHRRSCNECAAVANLRTINTAQATYKDNDGGGAYGTMPDLIGAMFLDDTFMGTKAGYNYSIALNATRSHFTAEAVPISTKTGRYGYYSVPDAVIRYSTNVSLAPRAQAGNPVPYD